MYASPGRVCLEWSCCDPKICYHAESLKWVSIRAWQVYMQNCKRSQLVTEPQTAALGWSLVNIFCPGGNPPLPSPSIIKNVWTGVLMQWNSCSIVRVLIRSVSIYGYEENIIHLWWSASRAKLSNMSFSWHYVKNSTLVQYWNCAWLCHPFFHLIIKCHSKLKPPLCICTMMEWVND